MKDAERQGGEGERNQASARSGREINRWTSAETLKSGEGQRVGPRVERAEEREKGALVVGAPDGESAELRASEAAGQESEDVTRGQR